jgi:hypothetical protein
MEEGRNSKCYAETNAITERMQLNSIIAIIKSAFFIP